MAPFSRCQCCKPVLQGGRGARLSLIPPGHVPAPAGGELAGANHYAGFRLLATPLSEVERAYLHRRIAEERAELERLQWGDSNDAALCPA